VIKACFHPRGTQFFYDCAEFHIELTGHPIFDGILFEYSNIWMDETDRDNINNITSFNMEETIDSGNKNAAIYNTLIHCMELSVIE
jgi:hypothetical protein